MILKRIKFFFLFFPSLYLQVKSDCNLKILKDPYEKILIKNRYIELEIIPKYGGVISKYNLLNSTILFPFQIEKKEFYPGSPIFMEWVNFAGCSDWLWPGGGNLKKENYDYEILENNKERVIVNLKNKTGIIERRITIYRDKSLVEIDVKEDFDKKSYWFHPLFCVGGKFDEDDFLVIPCAKTEKRVRNLTEIVDKEEIRIFHPETSNYFYLPYQRWFCLIDKNKKLLGGVIIERKFINKDTIFYSWNGIVGENRKGISLEVIYPENEKEFKIYLVSLSGFENISYLSENIGIYLESKERVSKNENIPFLLKISSPSLKNFNLMIGIGKESKEIFLRNISPLKIFKYKGSIKGIEESGRYRWRFKIIKDGEIIEDFEILKELEVL
ncbi:MAG: hypothetical protein ACP5OB_07645 [Candidatus Ratteibacteria bacterium]